MVLVSVSVLWLMPPLPSVSPYSSGVKKASSLSLSGPPTWSDGGQLSGSADPQTDEAGHLIRLLPSTFPQLEPLRGRRVLHRPGQHHLAHELVLHRVAVPHLRKSSQFYMLLLHLSLELYVSFSSPLSSVCSSYCRLPKVQNILIINNAHFQVHSFMLGNY